MSKKMKQCHECGEFKPLSEFVRNKAKKYGFEYHCKKCHTDKQKERNKTAVENARKYNKACLLIGGFKVFILNHVKNGEYKYNVVPTEGEVYKTNDKERFLRYLELHC